MNPQHLSDEAVAACADGMLTGQARDRALRHTAGCPECRYAVVVQREAVWALRAAPAPTLPSGLLARLCELPRTTPISLTPAAIAADGSTMFATFGAPAALVPPASVPRSDGGPAGPRVAGAHRVGRLRPIASTAAVLAVAGVLAVGSAAPASGQSQQRTPNPISVVQPGLSGAATTGATVVSVTWHRESAH